jgi:hypothetical protein
MRKAILLVLVVLSLWGATSWQAPQPLPQWRVVAEQHLFSGTGPFSVPILTPQPNKVYRLTAACAVHGISSSEWLFAFGWEDRDGFTQFITLTCFPDGSPSDEGIVSVLTPQSGTPVTLSAQNLGGDSSTYDAIYTIETLQ